MAVYVVAQLNFRDRERYDKYQAAFFSTIEGIECTPLAGDETPTVIEGDWQYDKVVLLSFKDQKNFELWANSDAYQKIAVDRRAGAEGPVLLVKGMG